MFGLSRREKAASAAAVFVALIGEGYRRSYVKDLLGGRTKVAAELVSDRRAHLLAALEPEVVILDCASEGINPPLALPKLADLEGSPRIVALTDGSVSHGPESGALATLGADAIADIQDPRAVVEAVFPTDFPTGTGSPHRRRRALAAA